jgi:60 kDa SS-A/Ro ribonucleoprotein
MSRYASHVGTLRPSVTPVTTRLRGRTDQVKGNDGGFVFAVDCWTRLDRFLILGCEGGTFYASERKLTKENASCILECHAQDPARTVNRIAEISVSGRAPKNDAAIFALALLRRDPHALANVPAVCRTGTHLFQFVEAALAFGGWSRSLRRCVAQWYNLKPLKDLSYQLAKYQSRNGWSHKDLIKLAHVDPKQYESDRYGWRSKTYEYVVGKRDYPATEASFLYALELAKGVESPRDTIKLITEHGLPRECVKTEHLNDVAVWAALLHKMPMHAMVRNLGKMTQVGLLGKFSVDTAAVVNRLLDPEYIAKSRLHPLAVLTALKVYSAGHGMKGSLSWSPDQQIVDALDSAFYLSFKNVEPTGKRFVLGVDVSPSMGSGQVGGSPLTPREAAAAMAMVLLQTEPQCLAFGFTSNFVELGLSKRMRLDAVIQKMQDRNWGGTDCSLPMRHCMNERIPADAFIVITDNDTNTGQHPNVALQAYRNKMNIPRAKLVTVGMTATNFTIADPTDGGMLDCVGFDTATPQIIGDFCGDHDAKK